MVVKVTRSGTAEVRGIGSPDYAAPKPVGQVGVGPTYTLTDLAELAARLGSIVTFDRRGNIVWWDDFEGCNLDKWSRFPVGTSEISSETARSGTFSCKLTPGSFIGTMAYIEKFLPLPPYGRVGFEFSFTAHINAQYIYCEFYWMTGEIEYVAEARYYPTEQELRIHTQGGPGIPEGWTTIAENLNLMMAPANPEHFHTIKLVIDPINVRYHRLIFNDATYDISNYPLPTWPSVWHPVFYGQAGLHTAVAAPISIHIDDAIFTQNEPANV